MNHEFTLTRDTKATVIPAGTPMLLNEGTSVYIAQTLGGNITVRADGGLFRIDASDADALGPEFSLPQSGDAGASEKSRAEFSEQAVWDALKGCFDPEIPVNIVDLGLVYDLVVTDTESGGKRVAVKMTLTAQGCGMGPVIANDAKSKIEALPEVEEAEVVIVWDPAWTPQMISAEGRQILGIE